jgi:hypothetical protein
MKSHLLDDNEGMSLQFIHYYYYCQVSGETMGVVSIYQSYGNLGTLNYK